MSDAEVIVGFPDVDPAHLAAAVEAALEARTDLRARLRAGAEQSMRDEPADAATATRFQTLLELGYLVASADGFAESERTSLAGLLERVTASAIDRASLERHFRELDQAVAALGRRERLARLAAELDEAAAEEAIELVVTIAIADGCLSAAEHAVLVELAEHLRLPGARLHALVQEAAARVEEALP
jgi:tellurite resistance protein